MACTETDALRGRRPHSNDERHSATLDMPIGADRRDRDADANPCLSPVTQITLESTAMSNSANEVTRQLLTRGIGLSPNRGPRPQIRRHTENRGKDAPD